VPLHDVLTVNLFTRKINYNVSGLIEMPLDQLFSYRICSGSKSQSTDLDHTDIAC
jgi:hypothetical protein